MTPFLKSTGTAQVQSSVVFLLRVQEQLLGVDGRYYCKIGFKDLRQKPTQYSISSYDKTQFVMGQASQLIKNNRHPTKWLGHVRGAIGIQPVDETGGEQGLARMRYEEGLSNPLESMFWVATGFQPSVRILEKAKARQGSQRVKDTPRMAQAMK